MAGAPHRHFPIYKKHQHLALAFMVMVVPIVLILLAGAANNLSIEILVAALGASLFRLVLAYFISLVAALILAILLAESPAGDFFIPILDMAQNLPSFALIPLFVLWLGYSDLMTIIFAATSIIWPILFYLLSTLKTARTDLNDAAQIFGARGWRRIWYYLIPLAFPSLITGSIVAIAIGWEAIIGVEIISSLRGIGSLINQASGSGSQTTVILAISSLLLIVFAINKLIWLPLLRRSQLYAD